MDRRGFLKLAGVATAATFMTRFPLFPREGHVYQLYHGYKMVPLARNYIEVALVRRNGNEVKARGYLRVRPESVEITDSVARVKATFPTVLHNGWPLVAGAVVYRDGRELYRSMFPDALQLTLGQTLSTTIELNAAGGTEELRTRALHEALGVA